MRRRLRRHRSRTRRRVMTPIPNEADGIKITAEDLASVKVAQSTVLSPATAAGSGAKVYGTINETAEQLVNVSTERGSILLQGWFYLGVAGLIGALAGWGITKTGFLYGGRGGRRGQFGGCG